MIITIQYSSAVAYKVPNKILTMRFDQVHSFWTPSRISWQPSPLRWTTIRTWWIALRSPWRQWRTSSNFARLIISSSSWIWWGSGGAAFCFCALGPNLWYDVSVYRPLFHALGLLICVDSAGILQNSLVVLVILYDTIQPILLFVSKSQV